MTDPVALALSHGYRIKAGVQELRDKCKEDLSMGESKPEDYNGEGVVRRAKELPGLIASSGLVPALTFYMSKIESEEELEEALKLLEGKEADICKLKEALSNKEGAGYSIMLAAVIDALEKLAGVSFVKPITLTSLAGTLLSLRTGKDHMLELEAEYMISDYLIEAKKVLEALLGGD